MWLKFPNGEFINGDHVFDIKIETYMSKLYIMILSENLETDICVDVFDKGLDIEKLLIDIIRAFSNTYILTKIAIVQKNGDIIPYYAPDFNSQVKAKYVADTKPYDYGDGYKGNIGKPLIIPEN